MCGRFAVSSSGEELGSYFDVDELDAYKLAPAWNIKPTQQIPVVLQSAKGEAEARYRLEQGRWSLLPQWAKEPKLKYPTFNARSETAAEKTTFKASVRSKRAIIPATGYYEWKTVGKTKTPYFIYDPAQLIAFAGLYTWWRPPGGTDDDWILTATILTREAVGDLQNIHDRTPVTLPRHLHDIWLDAGTVGDQALVDAAVEAATPVAASLQFHQVGPVTGDDPDLINPL
ncbi:hypothetical protein ALI44B_01155 [Leifsonia sp. ALI-44-B]|uniref:SOS response-associated peptidase n=1 Tax=Leifsonia sp. ALI-44-B TaxID=1933776 RepID=UPI00097BC5D6|nr:SOS response-associated peptidase [Leifsonia sp. ALI-44-B]ONI65331.1 hypothetical protein ALI44B_01155 [Leifsonia sp. ALI-44-B]